MFDIGIGELLLTGVVALIVIGPEKLPAVARTFGALVGRMQRFVSSVKSEIQGDIDINALRDLKNEIHGAAQSFREQLENEVHELRSSFHAEHREADSSDDVEQRQIELPLDEAKNSTPAK